MFGNKDESGDHGRPSKADRDAAKEDAAKQEQQRPKGGDKK